MHQKGRFLALVCASMLALAGKAQADPLLPDLGNINIAGSLAGESKLLGAIGENTYLDWIVFKPGAWTFGSGWDMGTGSPSPNDTTQYLYTMQVENASGETLERATIRLPIGSIASFGWITQDLDNPGWNHDFGSYPNLATEHEGYTKTDVVTSSKLTTETISDKVAWNLNSLTPGNESEILFFTSLYRPTYGSFFAIDGNDFAGPAPIPVPEPGTLLILGSAVGGFIASKRKKA